MIALSDVFRLSSESLATSDDAYTAQVDAWAVFPLVRLRPEQVIGSLFQAGHVRTIDQTSNPLIRVQKFGNENDFLNEYGDLGDDELLQQVGTIPQALLRMNGRFTEELSQADLLTASGELLRLSPDDETLIANCYLACLCRRPTNEESAYFLTRLGSKLQDDAAARQEPRPPEASDVDDEQDEDRRQQVVEDLYWTLFNSPEFSWNH